MDQSGHAEWRGVERMRDVGSSSSGQFSGSSLRQSVGSSSSAGVSGRVMSGLEGVDSGWRTNSSGAGMVFKYRG